MHEVIDINGAQFIFSPFKNTQTASLGIFIKNGARFEGKKIKGAAHFLEHLIFKGSKKYSCKKIKQEIEGRGGSLNGFTSQEITGYYAHLTGHSWRNGSEIVPTNFRNGVGHLHHPRII